MAADRCPPAQRQICSLDVSNKSTGANSLSSNQPGDTAMQGRPLSHCRCFLIHLSFRSLPNWVILSDSDYMLTLSFFPLACYQLGFLQGGLSICSRHPLLCSLSREISGSSWVSAHLQDSCRKAAFSGSLNGVWLKTAHWWASSLVLSLDSRSLEGTVLVLFPCTISVSSTGPGPQWAPARLAHWMDGPSRLNRGPLH